MILLDAYALTGLLNREAVMAEVEEIMHSGQCGIPCVNLGETLDFLLRRRRMRREEVQVALRRLTTLQIVEQTEEVTWAAAVIRARYYHRATMALSIPDCVLLATATTQAASLTTSDPAVVFVAKAEGIDYIGLPDSLGVRP